MNNNNMSFSGEVTVILEDKKTGKVLKQETHKNAVTDVFKSYMLALMGNSGCATNTWMGRSKTASTPLPGQYSQMGSTGKYGIYCMQNEYPVTADTITCPYTTGINTLNPDVLFYNVDGVTTEGANTLQAIAQRSSYGVAAGDNSITIEYQKTTGAGSIRSIIFGREHTDGDAGFGCILGEPLQVAGWNGQAGGLVTVLNTEGTALDHRTDKTVIWQGSGSSQNFYDMKTKNIYNYVLTSQTIPNDIVNTPLTGTILNTILSASNGTTGAGGSLIVNGYPWRADYASIAPGTSVTCTLKRWIAASTPAVSEQKSIEFPITAGTTYPAAFIPVNIYRPDNNTIEVFMPVSYGKFGDDYGINVQKAVISNLTGTAADVTVTITDLGVFNDWVPCSPVAFSNTLGFYDHIKQQYWFPNAVKGSAVDGSMIINETNGWCSGYIAAAADLKTSIKEWVSRATTGGIGSTCPIAPVRTELGVIPCVYNIAGGPNCRSYPKVGHVISGVVLNSDFVKDNTNILRVVYKYTLS